MNLKKISEQTIVITGATSGIGLTTARMAAEQGASLLLIARNYDALNKLADEINAGGGRAITYAADVADENALRSAANKAINELGGFDTWVNNAGGAIYGKIADVSNEDSRRLFETNFWGVVYGSRIAVEHLRTRGGALINVGSEVSDTPVPLIGMYAASKHAVKGFTDAFRMEIEADELPISVTLIKPTAIHTPFPEHAKNYMDFEPTLPPPVYAPELVAEAILHCAQNQVRDFFVGEMAAAHSAMATYAPRLTDKFMELTGESQQDSGKPADPNRPEGLYETHSDLRERGAQERFVMEDSLYQRAKIHPVISSLLAIGAGLGIAALLNSRALKQQSGGFLPKRFGGNSGENKINTFDIREKMEVVGADGEHLGTVDRVEYGEIKLMRKDSTDGKHHLIPTDSVKSIDGNTVLLSKTAEETRGTWKTVETETAKKPSGNVVSLSDKKTDNLSKTQGGSL
ncbi:MAG TPA: SDR family oxidoreductase [Pyrinomonadaceae bacterium]|jgi:short-subunit dehydrogenase|nr:SDR family oxidoreductase [Pyrinomonadaceae bacterium]